MFSYIEWWQAGQPDDAPYGASDIATVDLVRSRDVRSANGPTELTLKQID